MKALLVDDKNSYSDVYDHFQNFYFKKIAIVSKNYPLISNLSVLENITLPGSYHNKLKTDYQMDKVINDLKFLGFHQKLHSRKNELSDFEDLCVRILQGLYSDFKKIVIFGELNKYKFSNLDIILDFLAKERSENILFVDYNEMREFFGANGIKIIQKVEEW